MSAASFGAGEKEVAIGSDNLAFMTDKDGNKHLYTNFTKEQFDAAAAYDDSTYTEKRDDQRLMITQQGRQIGSSWKPRLMARAFSFAQPQSLAEPQARRRRRRSVRADRASDWSRCSARQASSRSANSSRTGRNAGSPARFSQLPGSASRS